MYDDIVEQIKWKRWARPDLRYQRLEILDRIREGTLYDHLNRTFRKDTDSNGEMITMERRKPTTKFNIARMVSRMCARKLFAGRHAPTISHPEKPEVAEAVRALSQEGGMGRNMLKTVNWGSVGSAAVPFRILNQTTKKGSVKRLVVECFKPMFCTPVFDVFQELKLLRVQYLVPGYTLVMDDYLVDYKGKPIEPRKKYWFIKDTDTKSETIYFPIPENEWIPIDNNKEKLLTDDDLINEHGLGFVPAHWFTNLSDGVHPDGACTFSDSKECIVEIDYVMSSIGLGVHYNAAPQVVIKGNMVNVVDEEGNSIARGPTRYLHFEAESVDPDGGKHGEGGADLLEMTGEGIKVGINDYMRELRKMALEQISASRKDPDKVTTAMSGKGIELIEQEFMDLVHELRTSYGDEGYLKFMKKASVAAIEVGHPLLKGIDIKDIDAISLDWPPLYELSAAEFQQLTSGLKEAVGLALFEEEEARQYMRAQIDVPEMSANKTYAEGLSGGAEEKSDDPHPEQPEMEKNNFV